MEDSKEGILPPLKHEEIKALKEKIKEVMTSVLTEVFQSNGDLQEAQIQSRLYCPKNKKSPGEIQKDLEHLEEALHRLDLFCQSAKKQLSKAIDKTKKEQNKIFTTEESTLPLHHFSKDPQGAPIPKHLENLIHKTP